MNTTNAAITDDMMTRRILDGLPGDPPEIDITNLCEEPRSIFGPPPPKLDHADFLGSVLAMVDYESDRQTDNLIDEAERAAADGLPRFLLPSSIRMSAENREKAKQKAREHARVQLANMLIKAAITA